MANEIRLVGEVLVTDFVLIDADQRVAEARESLANAKATYGVVTTASNPIGLITTNLLADSDDAEVIRQMASDLPISVVDVAAPLDQAVFYSVEMLLDYPEMVGLVAKDSGQVVGIIPRQALRQHAKKMKSLERDITELAGVSQTRARYFYCPQGPFHYKELVIRYDPDNPPRCPTHWSVALIEE